MWFRAVLAIGALGSVALGTNVANAKNLTDAELEVVERRLAPTKPYAAKMALEEGGTIVIEREVMVKASRIKKKETSYEAIVTGIVAPKGIVVHPRMDGFTFEPNGNKTKVTFKYVVHVDPGTKSGGRVRMTLSLVERTGFANVIHKAKTKHWFNVTPAATKADDLAADFWGYRHFEKRTKKSLRTLKRARLSGLSTQDNARMPALDRLSGKAAKVAMEFTKSRMRMWSAHRHMVVAMQSPDPAIAKLAREFLGSLKKRDDKLAGLPGIAVAGGAVAAAPPPAAPPPEPPPSSATVETLQPVATEPVAPPPSGGSSTLQPVGSYEPGTEGEQTGELPASARPRPPPEPPPPAVAATEPPPGGPKEADPAPGEATVELSDDPFEGRRLRKVTYIPTYFRSLVLDDPNIAHGGSMRFTYASVRLRETAMASAFFFNGQVALTRFFGLEVTVPTEWVNLDVDRARTVFAMGNPLVAAKWRLNLPKILGRRPVVTVRGRWAIPVTPLKFIPPTPLGAEDFSREPHFADTYAFFLEKTAFGAGLNAAWRYDLMYFGFQMYLDYFTPVESALDRTDFFTLGYGASVGALPFGDLVGFFLEARSVTLFGGPQRTEFFTYLGARGRLADFIEPALWIAHPIGSVSRVSGFQFGVEMRFSYDLQDVIEPKRQSGRNDPLLQ